jgi:hypothetical protein
VATRSPTAADILLAFRQAKRARALETGAIGRFELADFELELGTRVRRLQRLLRASQWFERIPLGRMVVVPRTSATSEETVGPPHVVQVGLRRAPADSITVRLQLEPTPEFATTEILYLWRFGPALEAMLGPPCLGYRLKYAATEGRMDRFAHEVYEPWRVAFARYRDEPIREARKALLAGRRITIVSTDIASFFDSIDPSFLLSPAFVDQLARAAQEHGCDLSMEEYVIATRSLLRKYSEFRRMRRQVGYADVDVDIGMPIGALTSRLFANAALTSLDSHILSVKSVRCYRRYVDDIVIVASETSISGREDLTNTLARFFPQLKASPSEATFRVPTTGASFRLRFDKTRIHDLFGPAAIDFLRSIEESFAVVASERRAFLGDIGRLDGGLDGVELFGDTTALDRLPRLRDADRFTLRRFMAAAFIASLERCALLLESSEAARLLLSRTRRMRTVLHGGLTLDEYDLVLRLLRIALLCRCDEVSEDLATLLRTQTSSFASDAVKDVKWRGVSIRKKVSLAAMRQYLSRRIEEVEASATPLPGPQASIVARRAEQLRATDLRHLDREDEHAASGYRATRSPALKRRVAAILRLVGSDRQLSLRLRRIRRFIETSRHLGEGIWEGMTEVELLLSVTPPWYEDVSRRMLARLGKTKAERVGRRIVDCVNALRGTRYGDTSVINVMRQGMNHVISTTSEAAPKRVRVILCNLPVSDEEFRGAAKGKPRLTERRLRALAGVLRDGMVAATDAKAKGWPALLLLPELAMPIRWTRTVAQFAIRRKVAIVTGLEYQRTPRGLINQALGVFATGHFAGHVVRWTKRHAARNEEALLKSILPGLRLAQTRRPRIIVDSSMGRIGVLICSELFETPALAALRGQIELLLVPSWNQDTPSFDHLSHSASSLLLHAFVCIANNAEASDSRIVAPISAPRFEREWCRLVHRKEPGVIWGDLPIEELRVCHAAPPAAPSHSGNQDREFRPLPPGW